MAVRKIDGCWYVDLRHEGKRYRKKSPEDTQKGALAYQRVLCGKLSRGESIDRKKKEETLTFKDFAQQWFSSYVIANNKPSVQVTKRDIIKNHLNPFFGNREIKDIGTWHIEQFKTELLKKNLHPKTINNILSVLRTCMTHAQEWERIEKVPKIKNLKAPQPKTDFLTAEELKKLLSENIGNVWGDMILIAAHTGMRYGELCGLHWDDVNLQTRTITVQRSLVRKAFTTPKSHKTRIIPMTEAAAVRLGVMEKHGDLVFMRNDGRQITKGMGLPNLHKICDQVGIRRIGWHTLRHTFATTLVERGVPLRVVQQLLGHSTIKMTERYSHVAESSLTEAVSCLDNLATEDSLGSIWAVNSQHQNHVTPSVHTETAKVKEKTTD